jgi:GT2 family glycosyltransferase
MHCCHSKIIEKMFSIVIPSWNNLASLQLCIRSIRENSAQPHQIIVHVNDGSDGTLEWVKQSGINYTHSKENIGICYAMNEAAATSMQPYIYYLNDDMYCCPNWDTALQRKIKQLPDNRFVLSSRAIEPPGGLSPCALEGDFGGNAGTFQEKALLKNLDKYYGPDFYSGGSIPSLVPKEWWIRVGGYSAEFSPGMNSDNDFVMKMWRAGCRIFIGAGDSFVYHFRSQSTSRHNMNNGSRQFLDKWKISSRVFRRYYLRQGDAVKEDELTQPAPSFGLRLEYLRSFLKRRFL